MRAAASQVEPRRHHRQHPRERELAREAELPPRPVRRLLRQQVRREGREQRDCVLDVRVVGDVPARPDDDPTHREPYSDPSDCAYGELQARLPQRERPHHYRAHGYPVGDDARGVVDEALPFEDRHYAPRDAEPLGDGGRGYGVGGGDYGAEDEGRGPGEVYGPVGDRGDHAGRHEHETDGQKRDRPQVRPEVPPGGEERRDVEEWRQEQQEHHLRLERYPRQPRHETENQSTQNEQDGVGDVDPVGQRRERRDRGEQDQDRLYLRQCPYPPSSRRSSSVRRTVRP